ncbi:Uncharacterised protein [Klebsiella michiganensis]|uniref:Uncharacterized protein n=1 Tax=Klebsiella michiganensis TaxID=1134687 RepID=A0A7H4N055_9ENTR|nr:Uncharacterised protein [Klebsiella michiganensis]
MLQRMDCGKRKGIAQELLKTEGKCKALILVCRHFIYLLVCFYLWRKIRHEQRYDSRMHQVTFR